MGTDTQFDFVENGSVTSPLGFLACGVIAGLKKNKAPDLAMIESETECSFAATFTSNLFPAAPVQYDREICANSPKIRAVVANSGVANACTGLDGYNNAKRMAELTAGALSVPVGQVMIASTGRIGVQLPMDLIENGIREAAKSLTHNGGSSAAHAIMTTDTRPKELAVSFPVGDRIVTIGGMCKGAGMIAPKMAVAPHATMLCFLTTDADIDNALLSELLGNAVEASFNHITVDNDMSTNDTVILMANGASGAKIEKGSEAAEHFAEALGMVTEHLARSIVFDGEGVTKFVTVEVTGAASIRDAELAARAIANSPLCKTAWYGGDPNWGRVVAALGYSGAAFNPDHTNIYYDGKPVVLQGGDAGTPEEELSGIVAQREFTVLIDLADGAAEYWVWTCDVSHEYVKINADYHT